MLFEWKQKLLRKSTACQEIPDFSHVLRIQFYVRWSEQNNLEDHTYKDTRKSWQKNVGTEVSKQTNRANAMKKVFDKIQPLFTNKTSAK